MVQDPGQSGVCPVKQLKDIKLRRVVDLIRSFKVTLLYGYHIEGGQEMGGRLVDRFVALCFYCMSLNKIRKGVKI